MVDEYVASLAQKNPKQKLETLRLLCATVGASTKKDVSKAAPPLLLVASKAAGEPVLDIRGAAMEVRNNPHTIIGNSRYNLDARI